jgi:hypothetical protein
MQQALLFLEKCKISSFRTKFILPIFILFFANAKAQSSGIFESYAILSINGGANAYYDMQVATANPDLQGANLGTFVSTNSLILKGGHNKTYKNGGCNITNSAINYRVFKIGNTPGSFTQINEPFLANLGNPGDQSWEGTGGTTNIIAGLTPGTYTLEAYSESGYNSCGSGTHFSNNGGANYKATFSIIVCGSIPPPGMHEIYSIDLDNDGYTTFDIGYYIDHELRPTMESTHGVDSFGYNFLVYSDNIPVSLIYNNITLYESIIVEFEYTGSGPTFEPAPPCYYPAETGAMIVLIPVPFDGDNDGDGILNVDEDTNQNLNLMDDDDDGDGKINLIDSASLNTNEWAKKEVQVFPNPVINGTLHIRTSTPIESVIIYDEQGRKVIHSAAGGEQVDVSSLAPGMYFVNIILETGTFCSKILVNR